MTSFYDEFIGLVWLFQTVTSKCINQIIKSDKKIYENRGAPLKSESWSFQKKKFSELLIGSQS